MLRMLMARRALVAAGLIVAAWAVTRVVLLFAGVDGLVPDSDYHGYATIFSLVLVPFLVLAVVLLIVDCVGLSRRNGARSRNPAAGIALVLSAPLASPIGFAALLVGIAIIVTALSDRQAIT